MTLYNLVKGREDGYYKPAIASLMLFLVSLVAYLEIVQLYLVVLLLFFLLFISTTYDIFVKREVEQKMAELMERQFSVEDLDKSIELKDFFTWKLALKLSKRYGVTKAMLLYTAYLTLMTGAIFLIAVFLLGSVEVYLLRLKFGPYSYYLSKFKIADLIELLLIVAFVMGVSVYYSLKRFYEKHQVEQR